jgi:peptide deformylase
MIQPVLRMGDARLLRVAQEVTAFDTPELHALIADMFDTMYHERGVGLAAPQIGVDLRLVIFGFDSSERYPAARAIPETILINPVLEALSEEQEDGWEGCLSVPGMRGLVPRYRELRYSGFDQYGKVVQRDVSDFHARVVQHECDHLDGILYPRRIRDLTQFGFTDVLFPDLLGQPDD